MRHTLATLRAKLAAYGWLVILASALLAMITVPASAQTRAAQQLLLKPSVTVTGALVTLGDLADGAGEDAATPLFRAPAPGLTGTVQAARVIAAIKAKGYEDIRTGGIRQIVVTRAGRTISRDDIRSAIAAELVHLGHARDADALEIRLDPSFGGMIVEADAAGAITVMTLRSDPRARRFSAKITVDGSAVAASGVSVAGYAEEVANIPTLARPVSRGDTITRSDIVMKRMPVSLLSANTVGTIDDALGMAARRSLRAGKPLRTGDLTAPLAVRRDDVVSIVFERPGLTLTVRGRAVESGAKGDVIAITNLQSRRVLQAEVTAPGLVTVRGGHARIAAAQ